MGAGEEKKAECGKKKMKEGAGDGGRSEVSSPSAAGLGGCWVLVAAGIAPEVFYQAQQLHFPRFALKCRCYLFITLSCIGVIGSQIPIAGLGDAFPCGPSQREGGSRSPR